MSCSIEHISLNQPNVNGVDLFKVGETIIDISNKKIRCEEELTTCHAQILMLEAELEYQKERYDNMNNYWFIGLILIIISQYIARRLKKS